MYLSLSLYIYIYIYVYVYIHTYIYICIHIELYPRLPGSRLRHAQLHANLVAQPQRVRHHEDRVDLHTSPAPYTCEPLPFDPAKKGVSHSATRCPERSCSTFQRSVFSVRPVHLLRVSRLRVLEANFPGDSPSNSTDMRIPNH